MEGAGPGAQLQVISRRKSHEMIAKAMNDICETVAATLGPHGNTISLQTSNYFEPRVTKDGVTVARAFQYRDQRQLASDLLNKALQQVDQAAGDGTTSTTIIANSIYQGAVQLLEQRRVTLPQLRRELQAATAAAVGYLDKVRVKPNEDQLRQLAVTAAGDEALGALVHRAASQSDFVQVVEEAAATADGVEAAAGVQYDQGYVSPYFALGGNGPTVSLDAPLVALSDGVVRRAEQVRPLLEAALAQRRPLLLVAADVQGDALAALLLNQLRGAVRCCAVRGFGYGNARRTNISDLALILGARELSATPAPDTDGEPTRCFLADGDAVQRAIVDNRTTSFELRPPSGPRQERITAVVAGLRRQLEGGRLSAYERETIGQRLARLGQKSVRLVLAGQASGEKRDRAMDALMALRSARRTGAVPGSGNAQLLVAGYLRAQPNTTIGDALLATALEQIVVRLAARFHMSGDYLVERARRDGKQFDGLAGHLVDRVQALDSYESARQQILQANEVVQQLIGLGGIIGEFARGRDFTPPGT